VWLPLSRRAVAALGGIATSIVHPFATGGARALGWTASVPLAMVAKQASMPWRWKAFRVAEASRASRTGRLDGDSPRGRDLRRFAGAVVPGDSHPPHRERLEGRANGPAG
jgi:hypothetical protein